MSTADTSHLSIGEVLSLLQEEFPDVTISKIRFLESQGLIDPERTPSGYRKFYDGDVERLRWILQQQRDHFLPLKVIKDRLADAERGLPLHDGAENPDPVDDLAATPAPPEEPSVAPNLRDAQADHAASGADADDLTSDVSDLAIDHTDTRTQPAGEAVAEESRTDQSPAAAAAAVHSRGREETPLDSGPTEMSLTAEELARATGLEPAAIEELQRYGLLVTHQVGPDRFFDSDAVVVARAAAGFSEFGVEARHLRMYKVSSEREAGFFEQVIMPLLKQRNPGARQRAVETVGAMAALGQQLHAALLRQALDDSLG